MVDAPSKEAVCSWIPLAFIWSPDTPLRSLKQTSNHQNPRLSPHSKSNRLVWPAFPNLNFSLLTSVSVPSKISWEENAHLLQRGGISKLPASSKGKREALVVSTCPPSASVFQLLSQQTPIPRSHVLLHVTLIGQRQAPATLYLLRKMYPCVALFL